jgi:hypothetical protein
MNAYRSQERINGEITTIVSNNSNFSKGKPGEPVLISWDDAITMFHEFGPRPAWFELERDLSIAVGYLSRARLRGIPITVLEHWLPRRKCCKNSPCTIRPANLSRRRWSIKSNAQRLSIRGFRRLNTWPRRFWT